VSETIPTNATTYLKGLAQSNGGWEWGLGWGTDTNATSLALQALMAAGEPRTSAVVTQGLAYLAAAQNADGGFPYDPDSVVSTASDANSTAYAIQALRATGEDPAGAAWSKGTNTPLSFLLSLQLPDGSIQWQQGQGGNQVATQQAVPALLGRPFPLRTAHAVWCPTNYLPIVHRSAAP
jgi:squalene cyclase